MWRLGDKLLETLWHLFAFWRLGIKREVEFAPAYEANVSDFHSLPGSSGRGSYRACRYVGNLIPICSRKML